MRLIFTDKEKNRSSFLRPQTRSPVVGDAEKEVLLFESVELSGYNLGGDAVFIINIASAMSKDPPYGGRGFSFEKENFKRVFKGTKLLLVFARRLMRCTWLCRVWMENMVCVNRMIGLS